MNWSDVGEWLKENAAPGAALVGSLLTGNVPGAVAAGVAMVSSATGAGDPDKVFAQLQTNPETLLRLKELAYQNEASIRNHIQSMAELELKDKQVEHHETQETIRSGDNAEDEYVRHTRPMIARQSWYATAIYVIGFEGLKATGLFSVGAVAELSAFLLAPAAAYLGFRSLDKWRLSSKSPKQQT